MMLFVDVGSAESSFHSLADLVAGNDDLGMTEAEIVAAIAKDGFAVLGGGAAPVVHLFGPDSVQVRLAKEFGKQLRSQLTRAEMREVNRLNATPAYQHGACASHNFCDANMPMYDASLIILKRDVLAGDGMADSDVDLFNSAWSIARALKFSTRLPLES